MREMLGKFPTPPHPDGPSLACPLCLLSLLNPQELLGQRVPSEGNLENRRGPGGLRRVCGGQRAQFKRPRKVERKKGPLRMEGAPEGGGNWRADGIPEVGSGVTKRQRTRPGGKTVPGSKLQRGVLEWGGGEEGTAGQRRALVGRRPGPEGGWESIEG